MVTIRGLQDFLAASVSCRASWARAECARLHLAQAQRVWAEVPCDPLGTSSGGSFLQPGLGVPDLGGPQLQGQLHYDLVPSRGCLIQSEGDAVTSAVCGG